MEDSGFTKRLRETVAEIGSRLAEEWAILVERGKLVTVTTRPRR
jgi:hypothetical protein